VTKFQDGIVITTEVMGCQVHAIGKAIRPIFADPVTNIDENKTIAISTVIGHILSHKTGIKKTPHVGMAKYAHMYTKYNYKTNYVKYPSHNALGSFLP